MLYVPSGAIGIPLAVHRAASGDYGEIARRAVTTGIPGGISYGFYLSNTCSEDIPFFTESEAADRSRDTFLGDYRARQQKDACVGWPRAELAAEYLEPVRSEIPVLILVGERDPVTPARWGHEIAAHFSNATVAVVPDGGHGFANLQNKECLDQLRAAIPDDADYFPVTAGRHEERSVTASPGCSHR